MKDWFEREIKYHLKKPLTEAELREALRRAYDYGRSDTIKQIKEASSKLENINPFGLEEIE